MKDKDGFTIQCKNSDWMIVDNFDNHDFVCLKFGCRMTGYHLCYADEHCRHYVPDVKEKEKGETE